ncbi:MAG TPA: alanyl-tRNA editing protein [Candidatus Aminicenantes bacterium]|nr:alanyl-tRNA editing protein [Candidatus Aminicenantes bacterium]HRY66073.1 alanyl-tRNA editing protein [Candidatus Aminicenantes bacterium]HRZ72878.1 alanyl-tRNA editing protein [Candidatus Aminicenantes bacterium]
MSETRRLYFDDACLLEFDAEVVERREHESHPAVVLDRTAFYPESGGQPWDRGTLGGVPVLQVLDLEGAILHVLDGPAPEGRVHGAVDRAVRFDHMQQHTGQHVLSQAFWELLKGETRSFHMGPDLSTLEIGLPKISDADCDRVEDRANAVVWEDRQVKTYFVPEERIGEVPLRRPPKKQGLLRVVEVDGFDYSACGGTHVRRTGEIGLIRLGGVEKIRGNLRFEFLCGGRALCDYRAKDRTVRRLAASFSCSAADAGGQVERISAEGKALKKRARRLEERLAAFEAAEIVRAAPGRVIAGVLEDKTPEEARFLALNIVRRGDFAVAYGASGESQGHVILARAESLKADLRQAVPAVAAVVPVKGGGGPSLVELVAADKSRLGEAVEAAARWLAEHP